MGLRNKPANVRCVCVRRYTVQLNTTWIGPGAVDPKSGSFAPTLLQYVAPAVCVSAFCPLVCVSVRQSICVRLSVCWSVCLPCPCLSPNKRGVCLLHVCLSVYLSLLLLPIRR